MQLDDIVSGVQGDEETLLMYKQSKNLFEDSIFGSLLPMSCIYKIHEEGNTTVTQNIIDSDETYMYKNNLKIMNLKRGVRINNCHKK